MAVLARFVVVLAIFIANFETVNQIKTETESCKEGSRKENPATNRSDLQCNLEDRGDEDGAIALPPNNDLDYSFSAQFTYEYQDYESKKKKKNTTINTVQKKKIEGFKKFITIDGILICTEVDESDNLLRNFGKNMLEVASSFIDNFPDISVDNFGKQSDTLKTNLHFRLDRQKITPKYDTSWGNHQIQINSQVMTKNKKNPTTSLAAVFFEIGYTYPKDVVKTAFQISLKENRQVYVTVNLECDE